VKYENKPPPAHFCMQGRWCECGDVKRRWCGHGVIENCGVCMVLLKGGGVGMVSSKYEKKQPPACF